MSTNLKHAWTVNALLGIILLLVTCFYLNYSTKPAFAAGGGWDTNGVMAMSSSGQTERLVLIDTKRMNIMIYRAQNGGIFRLTGSRSYQYDVEVEDSAGTPIEKGDGITFHEAKQLFDNKK